MNKIQTAYNQWAGNYDDMENKTRDVEASALRTLLKDIPFTQCLEIGCGTGKNIEWLATWAAQVVAIDFSEEMLAKAREKNFAENVSFIQADINEDWFFAERRFDLVTMSLVLEHIQDIGSLFSKANEILAPGAYVYLGEYHPFKQYLGGKARFDDEGETTVLECFDDSISEFTDAATAQGWLIKTIKECKTDDDVVPRVLCMLFQKPLGA